MKIIKLIQTHATGKNVAILFLLNMIAYLTIIFYSIPKVVSVAPQMKLFDVSPAGYSMEYAMFLLQAIGSDGRNLYLSLQLPLDFIYPGLFILSYTLLFAWLLKKNFDLDSRVYFVLFIPILAGVYDYAENILVIMMLKTYPDLNATLVSSASLITSIKSILTSIFFVLLSLSIIQTVWKAIYRKPQFQLKRSVS